MKLELIIKLTIITLFIVSFSEFIRTRKSRKLAYPLIIIHFLVAMPVIGGFIDNRVLNIGFAVLSFIITVIFIYIDLIITNKEKLTEN